MNKIKRFLSVLLSALLALPAPAFPAFDPVNDDTDIFLANPNIPAERPNVLIALDNTANWNTPFVNEKSALVAVINGLTDQFNVGLMMMPETGNPNDSVDGGYVRFNVRQMTGENKTNLASLVNNLDKLGDKGNNATHGAMLYEAFLYYAGRASVASFGKVKTDFLGTTDPYLQLPGKHALDARTSTTPYNSPIVDGCQKNFVILISNGPPDNNTTELAGVQSKLTALTGLNPPATIAITPSGLQNNWADEVAKYMANADVNTNVTGVQNVVTYVVEVNPGTTGQGPNMTALMKSTATNGKGKYFGVSDGASGTAIVDALVAIFSEIQAVNSVFAASTLPVSVNERGTNLNQIYIGVFRPDARKAPRWLGNLKMYNLAFDQATGNIFLADAANGPPPATGISAVNSSTGFVTAGAISFWTQGSSFWGFRDPSQNGQGGASDSPDGELVEKGGAAQQLRVAYPNAENPQGSETLRKVYTCTTGGNKPDCVANSALSATPFDATNTAIDASSLGLGTRNVSPLTGFESKAVTALTDRKSANLTNAALPVSVTSLSNGATTLTVTSLKTATPKIVTALSAGVSSTQSVALTSIVQTGSSTKTTTVTASAALPSNFVNGATVTFAGTVVSSGTNSYNGVNYVISNLNSAARTFTISAPNGAKDTTGGTASVTAIIDSTTATATVSGHGYASGDPVTIACATPSQFNVTAGITVVDANTFTYTITPAAGTASVGASPCTAITASGNTTTATAITSAAHGLAVGNTVNIFGATPTGYNGSFTVATVPNTTTFTYTVGSKLSDNTGSPVYMTRGGGTTVTVTTAVAHGFINGSSVNIANSDITGYNGAFTITSVPTATTFTIVTSSVLPANNSATVTASTGYVATVTATVTNHGFAVNDLVIIEGGSEPLHTSAGAGSPGGFTVLSVPNANTFTYNNPQLVAPTGSYTARPPTLSTKAIATVTAHGYTTGQQVVISGAFPTAYNTTEASPATITVVDANTFTYPLSSAPGPNTSTSVTSSVKTTTARATSVAHGFSTNDSVAISGATPAAFNGTYTITVVDANTFTYTIATAQGNATGTIVATGAVSSDRTSLIRWVRGEDNFADENANGSTTDVRASIHGDVLHSRPAVVNYNRYGSDNDVYIFYGANDGVFHAVKGGYATDGSATVQIAPGREAWGFIPTEFFGQLNRLRTNAPIISGSFKKPYFADGPIGLYTKDTNNNKKLGDAGDIVNLYVAMHRGGRLIYALDVNDPHNPKYLWKISNATSGFSELGQTWSRPRVVSGVIGQSDPVSIFGAGYDPAVEDIDPATITASSAASVTTAAGTTNRTMGRGIYMVNALTGALLWSAGPTGSGATTIVPGMDYAIPSDVTVILNESGGAINRAYVGDTGGNVWRIDFRSPLTSTIVTKIASIANPSTAAGRRKFLFAPDVVKQPDGFDAILIGSGDREHPFDTTITNRFYMFKDKGDDSGPLTGTGAAGSGNETIVESAMFDATTDCIQVATACTGSGDQATQGDARNALAAKSGWFVSLVDPADGSNKGEKVVGGAIAVQGTVFFGTNQPSASAGGGTCGPNLGFARAYQIAVADATALTDFNSSGGLTGADRFQDVAGGGYLPPPNLILTTPTGDTKTEEIVCMGLFCPKPPGISLETRLRKYWYKEIDQ